MTFAERFHVKVDRSAGPDACWPFTGHLTPAGYGAFWRDGRNLGAHRVAFELANGVDPGDMLVMHACDNRPCCNPAHLSLGTHTDNMADRGAKGRAFRPSGSTNPQARLTEAAVVDIRRLHSQGVPTRYLAKRFDISPVTVVKVVSRATWRHVA